LDEQVQLQQRQHRLQDQIDAFLSATDTFLDGPIDAEEFDDDTDEPLVEDSNPAEFDSDGDVFGPMDAGANVSARVQPETTTIPLPSSLGSAWCKRQANRLIVEQEIGLRQGQANDALHQIRIALAHKSFLFRTSIRNANSQQKKTRAWQSLHSTESTVRHHASVYSKARKALLSLAAPPSLMEKYKVLHRSDLVVSTAVVDVRKPSRTDATLAWFWNLDVQGDTESHGWMAECVYISPYHLMVVLTGTLQYIEFTGSEPRLSWIAHRNNMSFFRMRWIGLWHTFGSRLTFGHAARQHWIQPTLVMPLMPPGR